MASLKRIATALFWIFALSAGGWYLYQHNNEERAKAAVQKVVMKYKNDMRDIEEKTYATKMGFVTVLDIPVTSIYAKDIPQTQRCIVWQDQSSSSISCTEKTAIDPE